MAAIYVSALLGGTRPFALYPGSPDDRIRYAFSTGVGGDRYVVTEEMYESRSGLAPAGLPLPAPGAVVSVRPFAVAAESSFTADSCRVALPRMSVGRETPRFRDETPEWIPLRDLASRISGEESAIRAAPRTLVPGMRGVLSDLGRAGGSDFRSINRIPKASPPALSLAGVQDGEQPPSAGVSPAVAAVGVGLLGLGLWAVLR